MSGGGKVTPFLLFQFAVVAGVLLVTAFRPGPWDKMRIFGLLRLPQHDMFLIDIPAGRIASARDKMALRNRRKVAV